jgi:hypothetical protein
MQILLLFAIALPVIGALACVAGWVLGAAFGVLLSPFVFALTLWRMLTRP